MSEHISYLSEPDTTTQPSQPDPTYTDLMQAALEYARRKIPLFPCKPDKSPHYQMYTLEHGHLNATTDLEQIKGWWTRWPAANIGLVAGERSGILVLDVDTDKGGDASLANLETKHGTLPHTRTIRTGSGGRHLYFKYPTGSGIRCDNSGKLGPGLDVKGEGGYVIAPPSCTTSPYKPIYEAPPADVPEWLLDLLRTPSRAAGKPSSARPRSAPVLLGEKIPKGQRDNALASEAGRLHDGTRTLEELEADLAEYNERKMEEPKSPAAIRRIVRSIHKRTPCRPVRLGPPPEALKALDSIEATLWSREWRGMGGKSERDVLVALLQIARRHGQMIPAGVRLTIDYRTLALAASTGLGTAHRAIQRLRQKDLVRYDNEGREDCEAGALVIVARKVEHSNHPGSREGSGVSVPPSAWLFQHQTLTAPRLRWSSSEIRRLGKGCGQAVDTLEVNGWALPMEELAEMMGIKRVRDLRRRVVARLVEAGVATISGNVVSLTADWTSALNIERERAGETERYRLDQERYERDREAYRTRYRTEPDPAPTEAEMAKARVSRPDGFIGELEPAKPEDFEELVIDDFEDLVADFEDSKPAPEMLVGIGGDTPYNTSRSADTPSDAGRERTGAQLHSRYESSTAWKEKPSREKFRRMWVDPEKEKFFFPERYQKAG